MSDLRRFLEAIGLALFEQTFVDHEIDLPVLRALSEGDLKEIGIPLGPRRQLQRALRGEGTERANDKADQSGERLPPGERRQVTVAFLDLSGFTKLSSELDPEEVHNILNHYFEAVDAVVQRYGGAVDKHVGDAVMAVFGAPVAHTDDPERAVRAAADTHASMGKISETAGHDLQVHVGIACGQVVASGTGSDAHREYTVTGDSVNLASRLADLAEAGETLISDAVRRSTAGMAECTRKGRLPIAGFSEPIEVWRVDGVDPEGRGRQLGPLVGRQMELRQFGALIAACLDQACGHSLLVRGDPGVGKSRLVEEFAITAGQHGYRTVRSVVLDF